MFDLQIDKKKEKHKKCLQPERMYVNKHCVFYCSKSKTIHGGTPVQTIMYISITKGLRTLIDIYIFQNVVLIIVLKFIIMF
jgi:hypothetical protein